MNRPFVDPGGRLSIRRLALRRACGSLAVTALAVVWCPGAVIKAQGSKHKPFDMGLEFFRQGQYNPPSPKSQRNELKMT